MPVDPDIIQIKGRVTGNAGAPSSLTLLEPAYDTIGDVLYIGSGGVDNNGNATTIKAIAGAGVFATKTYVDSAVSGISLTSYLTTTAAAATYLTQSNASSTYLTQSSASSTYAPINNASLTGSPTAPTVSGSTDSSTKIATTAFVQAVVSALINSAPGTLDTLAEIAAALGSDPNFATTMTNALAAKLAKASNLSDLVDSSAARTNLGLGSLATQSAGSVNITGGTISGCVISGGTY